jgi:hypothetical protein
MAPPKVQILRTLTPNQPPQALAPGEFAIEMASTPPRLWIGVDTSIDPVGMKMLLPIGAVIVADAMPTAPINGALWWESDTGIMWMWYNDGSSAQWIQVNGLGGGGGGASVTTGPDAPVDPDSGDLWWETDTGYLWVWYEDGTSNQWVQIGGIGPQGPPGPAGTAGPPGPPGTPGLAAAMASVAVSCPYQGKPGAGSAVYVPITMALVVAPSLAGSVLYAHYAPTAAAVFTLNKISGGVSTALGTITLAAGSKTAFTLAGAGGSLAIGDVLQFLAPATQDATLADVGLTLHTTRPAATGGIAVSCPFAGKPIANIVTFVPVTTAMTIAANLAGSVGFANVAATAAAQFKLYRLRGGASTQLGTITAPAGSQTGFTFAGAGGALAIGDILQFVAPSTQDTTMSDIGITIQATRA